MGGNANVKSHSRPSLLFIGSTSVTNSQTETCTISTVKHCRYSYQWQHSSNKCHDSKHTMYCSILYKWLLLHWCSKQPFHGLWGSALLASKSLFTPTFVGGQFQPVK